MRYSRKDAGKAAKHYDLQAFRVRNLYGGLDVGVPVLAELDATSTAIATQSINGVTYS